MEYISTKEASTKWGISTTRITILANEGRIPGAKRLGKSWLIPASATKPAEKKPNHSKLTKNETDNFSFPLYHFRPDWSYIKTTQLSEQHQLLLQAETAVMECRFEDAYPMLENILHAPEDIVTEIGCLWNLGISCIALNKYENFSRSFLRLQMLLSEDFPHRNDLEIILDSLNTYIDTLVSVANKDSYNTDIHDQCLPMLCTLIGYTQLTKEATAPGTADTHMLELILRFLQTTSTLTTIEILHLHLLSIYSLRQNMTEAEKHARIAVQIAYENKLYFPLTIYYRYNALVLSPILAQYPKEFQKHCNELVTQFDTNFDAFLAFSSEYTVISKLSDTDFPYICAVLAGLSNTLIAKKLGVSQQTVNRRLEKVYAKFGVNNKKDLRNYLQRYM